MKHFSDDQDFEMEDLTVEDFNEEYTDDAPQDDIPAGEDEDINPADLEDGNDFSEYGDLEYVDLDDPKDDECTGTDDSDYDDDTIPDDNHPSKRISIHVIIGILIVLVLGLCIYKYKTFGNRITQEDIDAIPTPDNPEIETYDYFAALLQPDGMAFPEDDGVTTVVCFGNAPFADDRNSNDNICSLFAEKSGATVYNFSIADSLLAAHENPFSTSYPMDAFSFSNLVSIFADGNTALLEEAYAVMGTVPPDLTATMDELCTLDFRTVDYIYIMYDGSDYLENSMVYHDEIPDEPRYIAGSLTAGIRTLKEKYPWIKIVVMSPTFAYAIDENGSFVSSDMQKNEWNCPLSLYFMKEYETAFDNQVSFIDNFYGAIHEDIASDYLTDNLHLNQAGRELIVQRMQYALEKLQ